MAIAAAAIVGGSALLSGVIGASASKSAASTQADAAKEAAQIQLQMYNQTAARLQPWVTTGAAANQQLGGLLGLPGYTATGTSPGGGIAGAPAMGATGSLTQPFPGQFPQFTPFQPTEAQLTQTPGYEFIKDQGTRGTYNASAAMGMGGSTLKGIDQFTTGLADTTFQEQRANYMQNYQQQAQTYQQQFSNYWTQLGNVYNMLSGTSAAGGSAAAGVGQAGTQAALSQGNFLTTAGTAQGQGILNTAGSLQQPLNTVGSLGQLSFLQSMSGIGSGTTGSVYSNTNPANPFGTNFNPSAGTGTFNLPSSGG